MQSFACENLAWWFPVFTLTHTSACLLRCYILVYFWCLYLHWNPPALMSLIAIMFIVVSKTWWIHSTQQCGLKHQYQRRCLFLLIGCILMMCWSFSSFGYSRCTQLSMSFSFLCWKHLVHKSFNIFFILCWKHLNTKYLCCSFLCWRITPNAVFNHVCLSTVFTCLMIGRDLLPHLVVISHCSAITPGAQWKPHRPVIHTPLDVVHN